MAIETGREVQWFDDQGCPRFRDPPRHGGCAGDTMSSDTIEIVEAWQRTKDGWERVRSYEVWVM